VSLNFDVEVANPYGVALPLTEVSYALASGDRSFLSGNAKLSGTVPARGRRTVSLPAKVEFGRLLSALSGVRPGQVVPYDASMQLAVDAPGAGRLELPVRKQGELPVPAVPEVRLAGVTWDKLSWREAKATIRIDLVNTNEFALGLADMRYALALAGADVGAASLNRSVRMSPGESATLETPISFSPLSMGMAVFNVLKGESASYRLRGRIDADTPFGPISMPYDSTGTAPLSN
jgi:LEA14-like dessication related protein